LTGQRTLEIDLKLQITPSGIPRPLMDFLIRTAPGAPNEKREGVVDLIALCNTLGLKVTLVITQPGSNA